MTALRQLLVCAGVVASASASAGPNDPLHVYGGLGYSYDDNLLRVADGEPAFDNTRGDSTRQATVGLIFEKQYSRQRILAQAKLTKVQFGHFRQLDYDGKDFLSTLTWQLGNQLSGHTGVAYNQVLAPYNDFSTDQRNLRTVKRYFIDGNWRFHPSWQVRAGFSSDKIEYDLLTQRFNNRKEDGIETGIDYIAKSSSTVGLQFRQLKGKYPVLRPYGTILVDDGFTQDEAKLKVNWLVSGVTQLQFLGGWVRREHAYFVARDASGANGRLTMTWSPRPKVSLTAAAWREFTAVESNLASYSLSKGTSLQAAYALSDRIRIDGQMRYENRNFDGAVINTNIDFADRNHYATLGLTYSPAPTVQLAVSTFHDDRSGISVFGKSNYKANGFSVNVNAQF